MKCSQRDCNDTAIRRVYWPGKNPAPVYCFLHSIKATTILAHIGVAVVVESIEKEPDAPDMETPD